MSDTLFNSTTTPIIDGTLVGDEEPYADVLAGAIATVDDMNATDKQQRSARAKIKRIRGRPEQRGVSAFDFSSIPGNALVAYLSANTWRPDPQGDSELLRASLNPFATIANDAPKLARLWNRPHYLFKVNTQPEAFRPPGSVAFHMLRPRQFAESRGRDVSEPFQDGDAVVLFDELSKRPMFYGTIVGVDRARNYDSASGGVAMTVSTILTTSR